MKSIQKFKAGIRYYSYSANYLYELIKRDGHDLTFKVMTRGGDSWTEHGTSTFSADKDGAFETVRLNSITVNANTFVPQARSISPERQKMIAQICAKDAEYRKQHGLGGDVVTEWVL